MNYIIQQFDTPPDWSLIRPAVIDQFNWGGTYRPKSEARLCLIRQEGFLLRTMSQESDPRAVYKMANDPVYKDSCLEFFVNFKPSESNTGYLNFECNANGALLCAYGNSNQNRKSICDLGLPAPAVKPFKGNGFWGYELLIPMKLIKELFGSSNFEKGDIVKGNFFKCGDDTEFPHYGSWTVIQNPVPNFHLPEYFGTLEIG